MPCLHQGSAEVYEWQASRKNAYRLIIRQLAQCATIFVGHLSMVILGILEAP